jgi:hypothetical protein
VQHTVAAASTSIEVPPADFFPGERLDDLVEMAIGEADPFFLDSQEDFFTACNDSTYEESSEDSGDDEDNDYPLEQMLLPPEMLHNVHSLRARKQRRRRGVLEDNDDRPGRVDAEARGVQSPYDGEEPLGEAGILAQLWSQPGFGNGSRGVDWTKEGGSGMRRVQVLRVRAGPGLGREGNLFMMEGRAGPGMGGVGSLFMRGG